MEEMKKLSVSQIDYWAVGEGYVEEMKVLAPSQFDYEEVVDRYLSTKWLVGQANHTEFRPVGNSAFGEKKALIGSGDESKVPVIGALAGASVRTAQGWFEKIGESSGKSVWLIGGRKISEDDAAIIINSVKAAAVELACEYGLTVHEFERIIKKSVNPWFDRGRWTMGLVGAGITMWGICLRQKVRLEFEGKFRTTSGNRPPRIVFKKTLSRFDISNLLEVKRYNVT
jgi:hypothetical protein